MMCDIPYDEMPEKIEELASDIERLENNWNELKEWLDKYQYRFGVRLSISEVLSKMQEIESRK